MSRVAAIDCGTNSIRLLIADAGRRRRPGRGGAPDRDRPARSGRGRHRGVPSGRSASGPSRPSSTTRRPIAAAGVETERMQFVATSAARDASNREEFFDGVAARLGVLPDVITGDKEARCPSRRAERRPCPTGEPVLVMDIGGGSTELIIGSADGVLDRRVSLDIGSVRLTERFLKTGPPTADGLAARVGVHRRPARWRRDRPWAGRHLDRRGRHGDHPGRGASAS